MKSTEPSDFSTCASLFAENCSNVKISVYFDSAGKEERSAKVGSA